jgi:hypothetical protein
MAGTGIHIRDTRNDVGTILIGNSEGTRSLARTRHRCEDNIKMYL